MMLIMGLQPQYLKMSKHYQITLPDPGTALIIQLTSLYDTAMIIGVFVLILVFGALSYVMFNRLTCRNIYEARRLEIA